MTLQTRTLGVLAVLAGGAIAGPAAGQVFTMTLDPAAGSITTSTSLAADLSGTFIGDFDPVTNPGGTQTLPGLFGGSGNNPIPYTATAGVDAQNTTSPVGSFILEIDPAAGTATVRDLVLDLLGGVQPSLPASVEVLYDTFRTINPDALFPGGVPIPIPLGDATILSLTAAQDAAPSIGVITPTGPGTFDITVAVATQMTLTLDVLGQVVGGDPVPVPVVLAGSLMVEGGTATLSITIDATPTIPPIQGPIPGPSDVPLDLPTILPPGQVAHLLFSGQLDSATLDVSSQGMLVASGGPACLADLTGDGQVDVSDFFAFVLAFSSGDPAADINGDGSIDVGDFFAFVAAFAAGCA